MPNVDSVDNIDFKTLI